MSLDTPIRFTLETSVSDPELRYVEMAVYLLSMCASELDTATMERVLRYLNARFFCE